MAAQEKQPRYKRDRDLQRTQDYIKERLKRIEIRYQLSEYEKKIKPAIDRSGLPTAEYIKKAIDNQIKRDNKTKREE